MRKLHYGVAMSVDGFLATEDGGYDWIPAADDFDWGAYLARFDTLLMGRGTYEIGEDGPPDFPGYSYVVVSTTLDPAEHPKVRIVSKDVENAVRELKAGEGKDIWLFGGGVLCATLIDAGLVDEISVSVIPAVLGSGIPLVARLERVAKLELSSSHVYEKSGMVTLEYTVTP